MSLDMFPDAAIDYILDHQETDTVTTDPFDFNHGLDPKLPRTYSSSFTQIFEQCYQTAFEHGWWDDPDDGHNLTEKERIKLIPEKIALMHSELSEALEEYRKGPLGSYAVDGKPEGFWVELADVIIRIADLAGGLDAIDELVQALNDKMNYNEGRPYRHGNKRA